MYTIACRECLSPLPTGRKDGRCDECWHSKLVLPVNYKRRPKKKGEEDDD
jgi:hypothetical protein